MLGLLKKHTPNILSVVIKYIYKKPLKYFIPDQDTNEGDLIYAYYNKIFVSLKTVYVKK